MRRLEGQRVLVVGLGRSGRAACDLLLRERARVAAWDAGGGDALERTALELRSRGVAVFLGHGQPPQEKFNLVVVSPGVPLDTAWAEAFRTAGVPVIGEIELGWRFSSCLNISVSGTNGKTTTTELIARVLEAHQRRTVAAGNIGVPLCSVVEQSRELDFLTLEVSSFQLDTIEYFRPAIAVLTNITPDHLDRYTTMDDYRRSKGRLFENQQAFDWAIVQSDALAQLSKLGIAPGSKVITFSASDPEADIWMDRGLIISRIEGWDGPLLDMDQCKLRGPHNAENVMAVLAVSRALRLPLEATLKTIREFDPARHRCELLGEVAGVGFVNDSKATNPDAMRQALRTMPVASGGRKNVILIAGGRDKGFEYHEIGPLLGDRVKGAILIGEAREKLRAAWGLFTPCTLADSLLEAVQKSVENAVPGDVVLLSPACSSFDMFRDYQHRGDVFRDAVASLGTAAGGGASVGGTIPCGAAGTPANRELQPVASKS